MLVKRTLFVDKSINRVDYGDMTKAIAVQAKLSTLAMNSSLYPERRVWMEVRQTFHEGRVGGMLPNDYLCEAFLHLSHAAYRFESSLYVSRKYQRRNMEHVPITIQIKLFQKESRESLFTWLIEIVEGNIARMEICGPTIDP